MADDPVTRRFPIRYAPFKGAVLTLLGVPRRTSFADVGADVLAVRLGWAFRARIPRRALAAAGRARNVPLTAGVHGWRGRWLVNGAGTGIVEVHLGEPVPARVAGFPVRLRTLAISLDDPEGFLALLRLPPTPLR